MGNILDKPLVLDRIKEYYKLKGNAELARFLGVAPNTITNWYGRKTFDIDVIYTKCVDIDMNWLLTGEGNMLRTDPSARWPEHLPENRPYWNTNANALLSPHSREPSS